jgi:Fic family protein
LLRSLQQAIARIESVLGKARFWQAHRESDLSLEQTKVLNRLLDGGERGFEHGISAAQYQAVAKVSKATATRHLASCWKKVACNACRGVDAARVTKLLIQIAKN